MKPSPYRYISKTIPVLKAQGSLWENGQKDCKTQRIKELAASVSFSNVRSYTRTINITINITEESTGSLNPRPKIKGNYGLLRAGRNSLSQGSAHQLVFPYQYGQSQKHAYK